MPNIEQALQHHRAGRLQEAEAVYRQILATAPDHADALHMLGVLSAQTGKPEAAAGLIERAIRVNPKMPDYYNNLGQTLRALGKLEAAVGAYQQALVHNPNHAAACYNLGLAFDAQGKLAEAVTAYRQALTLTPKAAAIYNDLGVALQTQGNLDDAVTAFEQARALKPSLVEAHYNLGNALKEQAKLPEAATAYQQALALKPDFAEAHNNLGNVLKAQGKPPEAATAYQQALALKPDFAEAHNNLGSVLEEQSKLPEAITAYQQALALKPDFAEAHSNLGNALRARGDLDAAIASYQQVLLLKPDYAPGCNNLGLALADQNKLSEAISVYQQGLALNPDSTRILHNLGNALVRQGKMAAAISAYRRALALEQKATDIHSSLLCCLNYCADIEPTEVFAEHRRWANQHTDPLAETGRVHANTRGRDRRLRIGYLSPDFRTHSVAFFIEPLLGAHDRKEFEVVCYTNGVRRDAVTKHLQGLADKWRDIVGLSDVQAAELIQEDGVDILVDLVGHTGNNRLLVFARKPAPVQISYLGYPNTTGLSTIDYRLTDAWADPPGDVENLYTEELVRLPGGFLCYHPPSPSPEVAPLPALTSGQVTFASFNNTSKVCPDTVALWAQILRALPEARLTMKSVHLGDSGAQDHFAQLFEQNGVSRERVELLGWASSIAKHLELYNRVDIGLDPFPYNGTTTTCEALWMGVPVITLAGHAHAARVGVSLLSSVGCPELIAETPEAYVALAVHWASDLERLKALRNRLREQMRHSPLTDASGFARRVEAAYRTMWRRWCEKPQRMPRNQA